MQVKLLEVRDEGTFIPILAVNMNPGDRTHDMRLEAANAWEARRYLLRRVGYPCDGRPNIVVTYLSADGQPAWSDPYGWTNRGRTIPVAHNWIIDHWHELHDGSVVDVQFILGETAAPKLSERETA